MDKPRQPAAAGFDGDVDAEGLARGLAGWDGAALTALDLDGGMLYGWCELRQDDRVFNPSRILSVAPVG